MIAWTGTVTSIFGSFLVALGYFLLGYVLFLIGAICWLIVAYERKDKALGLLNLVFLCANILGLVNLGLQ